MPREETEEAVNPWECLLALNKQPNYVLLGLLCCDLYKKAAEKPDTPVPAVTIPRAATSPSKSFAPKGPRQHCEPDLVEPHTELPKAEPCASGSAKERGHRKTSGRSDLWKGENTIQERNQKRDFSKVSKWSWVISFQ